MTKNIEFPDSVYLVAQPSGRLVVQEHGTPNTNNSFEFYMSQTALEEKLKEPPEAEKLEDWQISLNRFLDKIKRTRIVKLANGNYAVRVGWFFYKYINRDLEDKYRLDSRYFEYCQFETKVQAEMAYKMVTHQEEIIR